MILVVWFEDDIWTFQRLRFISASPLLPERMCIEKCAIFCAAIHLLLRLRVSYKG